MDHLQGKIKKKEIIPPNVDEFKPEN